jgi:hypothetical protein
MPYIHAKSIILSNGATAARFSHQQSRDERLLKSNKGV